MKCECGVQALKLTSQKEHSKGRQFYTCGNDRACNFFAWVDAEGSTNNAIAGPSNPTRVVKRARTTNDAAPIAGPSDSSRSDSKNCLCGELAVQRQVVKEGQNKGRMFWTCAKSKEAQCGFFEWADQGGTGSTAGAASGGGTLSDNFNDKTCFKVSKPSQHRISKRTFCCRFEDICSLAR